MAALVRGGIDRGRAKRRRRTVGTAFVAAIAVGVVGIASSVVPEFGLHGGGAGSSPPVLLRPLASGAAPCTPARPRRRATAASRRRSPEKQVTTPIPTADIPVKAADLPRLFTKLYPGKVTPAEERTGRIIDNGRAGQYAHFLWNGFMTSVGFAAYAGTPAQRCREVQQDASQSGRPPVICVKRPDGTVLVSGRETAPARDGGGTSQGAIAVHQGWLRDLRHLVQRGEQGRAGPGRGTAVQHRSADPRRYQPRLVLASAVSPGWRGNAPLPVRAPNRNPRPVPQAERFGGSGRHLAAEAELVAHPRWYRQPVRFQGGRTGPQGGDEPHGVAVGAAACRVTGAPRLEVRRTGRVQVGEELGEAVVDDRPLVGAGRRASSGVHGHRLNQPGGSRHSAWDAVGPDTFRLPAPRECGD